MDGEYLPLLGQGYAIYLQSTLVGNGVSGLTRADWPGVLRMFLRARGMVVSNATVGRSVEYLPG